MTELDDLYKHNEDTSHCNNCSIKTCAKPIHTNLDYVTAQHTDILFLTDSFKYSQGELLELGSGAEEVFYKLIANILPKGSYQILASVKCPDVMDKGISPKDRDACRNYLEQTIRKVNPKLIIPLGNLALVMLTKKSGIETKRGKELVYNLDNKNYKVVPTLHPYSLVYSPKLNQYFQQDIKNAYEKYIVGNTVKLKYNYKIINDVRDLQDYFWLFNTDKTIAIDLETEGLHFIKDKILTCALCWGEEGIVIPIFHKESPRSERDIFEILYFIRNVCSNESNIKVGHNVKFDMRYLIKFGVEEFNNFYDTKIMAHFINQNMRKSLKDLVRTYYPEVLEKL